MPWNERVTHLLRDLPLPHLDEAWRRRCIQLLDFTSLNANDDEESIALFCQKARTSLGDVAGVCVYPDFVRLVADQFAGTSVKAVTVVNFPKGDSLLETVLAEINMAITAGAQEIDVVFPYKRYLNKETAFAKDFISACKAACGDKLLKVILETSALHDLEIIADASRDAFLAGADFIKTSTGKLATGASLEAAAVMLLVAQSLQAEKPDVGVKVSGGINRLVDAALYMSVAEKIQGAAWVTPQHFRIGASRLLGELVKGE